MNVAEIVTDIANSYLAVEGVQINEAKTVAYYSQAEFAEYNEDELSEQICSDLDRNPQDFI